MSGGWARGFLLGRVRGLTSDAGVFETSHLGGGVVRTRDGKGRQAAWEGPGPARVGLGFPHVQAC